MAVYLRKSLLHVINGNVDVDCLACDTASKVASTAEISANVVTGSSSHGGRSSSRVNFGKATEIDHCGTRNGTKSDWIAFPSS